MLKKAKPFFHYTKNEKRGIVVLMVLISFLVVLRILLPIRSNFSKTNSFTIENLVLKSSTDSVQIHTKGRFKKELSKGGVKEYSCCVDPNVATIDQLVAAGFSKFVATNIVKYRSSGARFSKVSDLYIIYGIDSLYKKVISEVVRIDNTQTTEENKTIKTTDLQLLDLNTADSAQLIALPGIGKVLTSRVIKYRKILGGFYSKYQLKEVYGLPDSTFKLIESMIEIRKNCERIVLNSGEVKDLMVHPYINKFQAQAIVKYRKLTGNPITFRALNDINVFTDSELNRLLPYLELKDHNLE